jgi:hypothetical protein
MATRTAAQARPLPDTARWKHLLTAGVSGGMICDVCCVKAFLIFIKAHVTSAFGFAAS